MGWLVLAVPDRAGEVVGAAGITGAGGSSACQCLPFLEAHAGSFQLACRRQISCLQEQPCTSAEGAYGRESRVCPLCKAGKSQC